MSNSNVPTAADIDWSRQDVPEGATHYNTSSGAFFKRLDSGLVQVFAETAGEWASLGAYTVFDLESSTCTIKRPESITDIARSIEAARIEEQKFKVKPCPHGCVAATIEQACMPWPDGDPRYFETSEPYAGLPKTNMLADAVGKFHATASESTKEMIKKMIAGKLAACIQDEQAERTYPHYFKDVSGVDAIDLYHVAQLYEITDPALFHAFKKIACAGKRGAKDQAQDVQEAIDALKRWQELSA